MAETRRGPRTYQVFISHRYDDFDIYSALQRHLVNARNFRYFNLSVEADKQLDIDTVSATKRSLASSIRRADVLLVFAHSAGEMVEYELGKAEDYGVPIIAIVDPAREQERYRRARSRRISSLCKCEAKLDDPDAIVAAIRLHSRTQTAIPIREIVRNAAPEVVAREAQGAPNAEMQRLPKLGIMSRLGSIFFGR